MSVIVVLPAYNESENLQPLLEKFVKLNQICPCKVVVVDDGSQDNTVKTAESFKDRLEIIVEKHPRNLGLGQTLRTGLKSALRTAGDADLIVTMDADNSHSPDLIPAMLKHIEEGSDVVIASRYMEGGKEIGLSKFRRLLSYFCSKIFKVFFPITNVRDYTCGYRAIKIPTLRALAKKTNDTFYQEESFVSMNELLLNLSFIGAKFSEVPLVLRYDLKTGKSKMKVFKTILRYLLLIYRLKLIGRVSH